MRKQNLNLLILTATITPPEGARNLARTDPKMRLEDYKKAFNFYLSSLKNNQISYLVFADNSNSDLTDLKVLCEQYDLTDRVELMSFQGLDYPPDYGRGYGEFKLIDYVMEHSYLISQLPLEANIWKITGRYILVNLKDIIKTRPSRADFYCHCRNIPMSWIDLYVLSWNQKAYQNLLKNICFSIRENSITNSAEQAFRDIVDGHSSGLKIVKRFRALPKLEGVRGFDNQTYQDMNIKFLLRKISNILLPWLWI